MTNIYMRALHAMEPLSRFLAGRFQEDQRASEIRNRMHVWDGCREDWAAIDVTTPGLASLRTHHIERPTTR